ncbi:glutamate N-acetyltransferase [Litorimonas taeanensis]|uniref:Arginine biosynthesis bifunctional protein ArgJ n=1 Tax=Litorimonas taeanensis TaxID=568099 RepID=A0A420WF16_9PROT|nr:bifunctional glutamate N-acetyltransferase/amino-acid acetyltransferase ArgJ [Litorimonas taeanensis]RKQ69572.1 glutamate N-acetyltransferase [Litorimonas taeanensis]
MANYPQSPFAPETFPVLPALAGFTMATAEAGVRYKGRTDLWVLRADAGTALAGVYTKNLCPGAPVDWSRKALAVETNGPRLVIVNSGTANVFGGQKSRDAVQDTAKGAAAVFGVEAETIQLASTGVIGVPLEASKLVDCFPDILADLDADGWESAARAIMTTDTHPKGATAIANIDGVEVRINGIAKGSGMIAPDMATMLAYIATDAAIAPPVLQAILSELVETSFNAITVDSDTSTSDTTLLLASGKAGNPVYDSPNAPELENFKTVLEGVLKDLALQIVKDGEGLTKFITVSVSGAVSKASAKKIGLSIANSPLVKTAIAGEDANWGRIVMAVGKAGEPAERDKLSIWMGPHLLAESGEVASDYTEDSGAAYMKNAEIHIRVDLGLGVGEAEVYTCDLTHGYIDINADYRS